MNKNATGSYLKYNSIQFLIIMSCKAGLKLGGGEGGKQKTVITSTGKENGDKISERNRKLAKN
jgi:hypothetical protein